MSNRESLKESGNEVIFKKYMLGNEAILNDIFKVDGKNIKALLSLDDFSISADVNSWLIITIVEKDLTMRVDVFSGSVEGLESKSVEKAEAQAIFDEIFKQIKIKVSRKETREKL